VKISRRPPSNVSPSFHDMAGAYAYVYAHTYMRIVIIYIYSYSININSIETELLKHVCKAAMLDDIRHADIRMSKL
jgi:hypothetical protein